MDTDDDLRQWAADQSAGDAWQSFRLSKPKNGLHLWRIFHAYTQAGLPLPDDVYRLLAELAARVVAAKTPEEVQRALLLKGRKGSKIGPRGVAMDEKNFWIAINYQLLRSGARRPDGRHLKPSEINQVVATEQQTTPGQVKNLARELRLINPRKDPKISQ